MSAPEGIRTPNLLIRSHLPAVHGGPSGFTGQRAALLGAWLNLRYSAAHGHVSP
jgi:hypothetical protein